MSDRTTLPSLASSPAAITELVMIAARCHLNLTPTRHLTPHHTNNFIERQNIGIIFIIDTSRVNTKELRSEVQGGILNYIFLQGAKHTETTISGVWSLSALVSSR